MPSRGAARNQREDRAYRGPDQAAEAKAKKAHDQAAALGGGPRATARWPSPASCRPTAWTVRRPAPGQGQQLRADLAKAKADEAARNVKHVKRTVASTAAEGLVPKQQARPARPARPSRAKTGQVAKAAGADDIPFRPIAASTPTKGTPAMTAVSGEAVDVETTEAMLADLKTQVAGIRSTFDSAGGSLAKAGLNKLANALNKADDALGSVDTGITDAERELAPHKDIADIAQSAGEMANSPAFYGV
jgi:hypothetical protein